MEVGTAVYRPLILRFDNAAFRSKQYRSATHRSLRVLSVNYIAVSGSPKCQPEINGQADSRRGFPIVHGDIFRIRPGVINCELKAV